MKVITDVVEFNATSLRYRTKLPVQAINDEEFDGVVVLPRSAIRSVTADPYVAQLVIKCDGPTEFTLPGNECMHLMIAVHHISEWLFNGTLPPKAARVVDPIAELTNAWQALRGNDPMDIASYIKAELAEQAEEQGVPSDMPKAEARARLVCAIESIAGCDIDHKEAADRFRAGVDSILGPDVAATEPTP